MVDNEGFLSVARPVTNTIDVYRSDGRLYCRIGSVGSNPGQMDGVRGMTLLPDGRLAVCDFHNNRVQLM